MVYTPHKIISTWHVNWIHYSWTSHMSLFHVISCPCTMCLLCIIGFYQTMCYWRVWQMIILDIIIDMFFLWEWSFADQNLLLLLTKRTCDSIFKIALCLMTRSLYPCIYFLYIWVCFCFTYLHINFSHIIIFCDQH